MRFHRSILPLLVVLCVVLVGCGSQSTGNSQPDSAVGPPPIVLRDPAPGQLEVYVSVTMGGYDRVSRDKTTIALSFTSNGRLVQFAGNDERLTCNGTVIPVTNQFASFQVAEAQTSAIEGKPFSCTYSEGKVSATLTFTVPYAPVLRSPQDLARVPRSTNTSITYEARGGKLEGIVALGLQAKAIARLDPSNGTQATVDTSMFQAGDGSIALTQTLDFQITETSTPFKSLKAGGTAMNMVNVTWV